MREAPAFIRLSAPEAGRPANPIQSRSAHSSEPDMRLLSYDQRVGKRTNGASTIFCRLRSVVFDADRHVSERGFMGLVD
jgi:hypothetical protein